MRFAVALPLWGYVAAFALALACAWFAYARVGVRMSRAHHAALLALRSLTLTLLVVFLLRPVTFVQASGARDGIVAFLVDASRSMRLADGDDGASRIAQASSIVQQLERAVGADFRTEVLTFGESVARAEISRISADARRSDLSGALVALEDRYRGQPLAGVVVVSDGGDTASGEAGARRSSDVPVFTVGVGRVRPDRDREILNLTAGEPLLSQSSIDLSVSASSIGHDGPMEMRLTANGRPLETRHVAVGGDGAPVHEIFTVSPSPDMPTVYTIEVPPGAGELVAENNRRSVLVPAQGRRRRVLLVEGAPGFEHTFLKRALARDQALDLDSVVRKGQNDQGRDTFFIQAAASRAGALAAGYPVKRAELFAYDAIIFGNIEGDFFSREQLEMTAEFVARRGGGLLVLGARSFDRAGLVGTPLEEVLPLDPTDRRSGTLDAQSGTGAVTLTGDGAAHPATRLAVSVEESRKRWSQLPPLPAIAQAGLPRPGAQVLAVARAESGERRPLLAAQRYGMGRTMIFAGEASWRWRMLLPASNQSYELVWRQLTRWIAGGAREPVEIVPPSVALSGTTESVGVRVHDEEYTPIANAEVTLRVTAPGGQERSYAAAVADPVDGRYTAAVRFDQDGVYTIAADVKRGAQAMPSARRPVLVGGSDLELSEPRLNDAVLRRIAESTGGRYLPAAEANDLPDLLRASRVGQPPTEMRDLWHNGFTLALLVALLAAEWMMRRRVGLA